MPRPERWLIYALGGGLGHLGRAVALARAARRPGRTFRLLTNSPFAHAVSIERELGEAATVVRIDPELDRERVARVVGSEIEPAGFDVLIVDTFPRGLGGELAPILDRLPVPKVLVHRDLDPRYVARANLRHFAVRYDRIILPGEPAPLGDLPRATMTAPWLLRDSDELLDRKEARRTLGVDDDERPVVAVFGCGRPEEVTESRRLADRLQEILTDRAIVRFASVLRSEHADGLIPVSIWPTLEAMRGIDLLVGSGGYHSVHEARATGTPLIAFARPRLYDRQGLRLRPSERVHDEEELIVRVRERLELSGSETGGRLSPYVNGTWAAVGLIESVCDAG
jgi:hypothetical protein